MSFLSDAWRWVTGDSLGAVLTRTAVSGFLLNKIQDSINADNQQPDRGSTITVNPSVDNRVPIIYGETFTSGVITDAHMSDNKKTMWFVYTLSEKTGTLLSTNNVTDSQFDLVEVYWNGLKLNFKSDGITASHLSDRYGNTDDKIDGQVRVYFYRDGSANPAPPVGFSNSSLQTANNIIPAWGSNHTMARLVFAIVRVDYNKEKNITGIGQMRFKVRNSMTLPGDCLYDYMRNTRYGAGLPLEEINI